MSPVWNALGSAINAKDMLMMNQYMNDGVKGAVAQPALKFEPVFKQIRQDQVNAAALAGNPSTVQTIIEKKLDFLTKTHAGVLMMNYQPMMDAIERTYKRIGKALKDADDGAACLNVKAILRDEWVKYMDDVVNNPTTGINQVVPRGVAQTLQDVENAIQLLNKNSNNQPSWAQTNSNIYGPLYARYDTLQKLGSPTLSTNSNWNFQFDANALSSHFKRDDSDGPSCARANNSSSASISNGSASSARSSSSGSLKASTTSTKPSSSHSQPPTSSTSSGPTYATGQCTVHIVQYLIPEGDKSPTPGLALNVTIKDAKHNEIGFSKNDSPSTWEHDTLKWGDFLNVDSQLPYVLEVKAEPNVKNKNKREEKLIDPPPPTTRPSIYKASDIEFKYAGQDWSTSDNKQCSVGGWADEGFFQNLKDHYDHETRQMDCTFNC